ncbi:MAG: hypothetical protein F4150_07060 [Chloroflexi bacterium]|nr:hypothetical protein [Chloroflexota bacterium]
MASYLRRTVVAATLAALSLLLFPQAVEAACSEGKAADGICAVFSAGSVREGGSLAFTVPIPEEWAVVAASQGGRQVSFDDHDDGDVHPTYGVELAGDRGEFVYASKCSVRSVVVLDTVTGEDGVEHPDISRVTTSGRRITVTVRPGAWAENREPLSIRYELHGTRTIRTVLNGRVTSSSTEACVVTGRSSGHGNPIVGTAVAEITITRSASAPNPALIYAREDRPGTPRANSHTPGADIPPNTSRCVVVRQKTSSGYGEMSWCGTLTDEQGNEVTPDYRIAATSNSPHVGTQLTVAELCKEEGITCTRH